MTEPIAPTEGAKNPAVLGALAQLNMGRVLLPLVKLATAFSFYFHLRETLSAAYIVRYNPDAAYIVLLTAYAGHREVRRWNQNAAVIETRARRGELFVVFWWLFYFSALFAANHVATYSLPNGLFPLCAEVTAIFFGTLTSQHLYAAKVQRKSEREPESSKKSIAERAYDRIVSAKGPVTRSQLQDDLDLPRSTLQRALEELESQGKIEWTGSSPTDPFGGFRPKSRPK